MLLHGRNRLPHVHERSHQLPGSLPGASGGGVSIGYGIAYPFGVVGVVLFVQLLPRLLHFDLNKEAKAMHSRQEVRCV